jgi:ABC-type sulfate/molybdate transport systems ATPase subunit
VSIGCRDLRVHAGGRELLRVAALEVAAGSTLAVLGPNGAGKSTLLRALGLLGGHRVTGEILLDSRPATRAQLRTAVAAVLQRPILRRGTVAANVAGGLRFRGVDRHAARRLCEPWLDALDIAHLADRDARTLSGGEAQRVSIARALAVDPRVLLLDEPFAGVDAATRTELVADLRAALDGRRSATILVTHDRHEATALATDTALLIDGRIRQHGPTGEILDHPVDAATARLLGFTNVLPPARTGLPHTIAARPEDCRIAPNDSAVAGGGVTVRGTLRRVVVLGTTTRVDVDLLAGTLTCLHPDPLRRADLSPQQGPVTVTVDRACALVDRIPASGSPTPGSRR